MPSPAEIRALTRDVAGAADSQIRRIVATVDALSARGAADQLIAPLRRRLTLLHPPHPLRFTRLLFHPLDPLIAAASGWRPEQPAIPRTALLPMAQCVRAALGPEAAAIEAAASGRTTADTAVISDLGRSLWPAAARILETAEVPARWADTGLGAAMFGPLARSTATLLVQMPALDRLCAETAHGLLPPRADAIEAILSAAAAGGDHDLTMMITLLLGRVPAAAALLPAGPPGSARAAMKAAVAGAAGALLDQLDQDDGAEAQIAAGSPAEAAGAVRRIASLLRQLDLTSAKPGRRTQIQTLRQRIDACCRARFSAELDDQVLAPLRDGIRPKPPALESAARALRILETEARAIGGGPAYDRMLQQAAEAVRTSPGGLDRIGQIRLVEILAGSDAALAMLEDRNQA